MYWVESSVFLVLFLPIIVGRQVCPLNAECWPPPRDSLPLLLLLIFHSAHTQKSSNKYFSLASLSLPAVTCPSSFFIFIFISLFVWKSREIKISYFLPCRVSIFGKSSSNSNVHLLQGGVRIACMFVANCLICVLSLQQQPTPLRAAMGLHNGCMPPRSAAASSSADDDDCVSKSFVWSKNSCDDERI